MCAPCWDRMWPFRRNPCIASASERARLLAAARWHWRRAPALTESLDCDVAIIGAGITGALIADALVATGRRIVMLDARDVAQGSTAATTALLQYEIDTHLVDLARMLAPSARCARIGPARRFRALEGRFPELLQARELPAPRKPVPGVGRRRACRRCRPSWPRGARSDRLRVAGRRGTAAPFRLPPAGRHPFRARRGARSGALHAGTGLGMERHGVRVFARTPRPKSSRRGARLLAAHRRRPRRSMPLTWSWRAGYESLDFLPREVAEDRQHLRAGHRTAGGAAARRSMPLIWESARPYLYLRGTPDGRLMIWAAPTCHSGMPRRATALLPRQVQRLARDTATCLARIRRRWPTPGAAASRTTHDGLPFIGAVPGMHPRAAVALCYGGNGITYSVHAARHDPRGHRVAPACARGRVRIRQGGCRPAGARTAATRICSRSARSRGSRCRRWCAELRGSRARASRYPGKHRLHGGGNDGPDIPEAPQQRVFDAFSAARARD